MRVGKESWLPYSDGSSYIRPGKPGKDILIGDINTTNIGIGGDQTAAVRVGRESWLPYSDGNSYIRPGRPGRDIVIGDINTANVTVGSANNKTTVKNQLCIDDVCITKADLSKLKRL